MSFCYNGCPWEHSGYPCPAHGLPERCPVNQLYLAQQEKDSFVNALLNPRGLPNYEVLQELSLAKEQGRVLVYRPGDTVFDRFKHAWTVTSAELHIVEDRIQQLYRCGHVGTEDYCSLFLCEICDADGRVLYPDA